MEQTKFQINWRILEEKERDQSAIWIVETYQISAFRLKSQWKISSSKICKESKIINERREKNACR